MKPLPDINDRSWQTVAELAEACIQEKDPRGYADYQLRSAIEFAIEKIGRDRTWEVIHEAMER